MERRMGGRTLAWGAALVLPTLLVLLFETRKWDRALMDRWVSGVMAPLEQQLGRFWGQISWCSAAELLTALLLAGCVLWLIWTVAGRPGLRPPAFGPGRCPAVAVVRLLLDVERRLLRLQLSGEERSAGPALPSGDPDPGDRPVCPAGGGIFHTGGAG